MSEARKHTPDEMLALAGSLRGLAFDLRGGPDEADELLLDAAEALEQAGLAARAEDRSA